MDYAGGDH